MVKIQICKAATRAMALKKLEVVNIVTNYIFSTGRTAIAVSAQCKFPKIVLRGLVNVRVY